MATVYFDPHIKKMLEVGVGCMAGHNAATDDGTMPVKLDDYETVRKLARRILARLRGTNEEGQPVPIMPPSGSLPDEQVELFAKWVDEGMPEKA